MRTIGRLALAAVLCGGTAAAQPLVVSEPTVIGSRSAPQPRVSVVSYPAPPEAVSCREGAARVVTADAFAPATSISYAPPVAHGSPVPPVGPRLESPVEFEFNVTQQGRVAGLKRAAPTGPYLSGHDEGRLQATLASWRFAPAARTRCRLSLTTRTTPAEETDRLTLIHLMTTGLAGEARRQVHKRANAPGDCYEGREPRIRVRIYPDWERLPIPAGQRAWVALDYDIDAGGTTKNVRVVASSGNAGVNAAAAEAVSGFRFIGGPRTGCRHYFWPPSPLVLAAPPMDKTGAERPGDDDCPDKLLTFVDERPYPPAFRERSIEGWAVLRFAVAPWGEIGGIEVVRAEPSEMFGRTASDMLRRAKAANSGRAYKGCAVPISFRMGDQEALLPSPPEGP